MHGHGYESDVVLNEDVGPVLLCMQTLRCFDFGSLPLLPFVQSTVVLYLEHADGKVRRETAITCAQLLLPPPAKASRGGGGGGVGGLGGQANRRAGISRGGRPGGRGAMRRGVGVGVGGVGGRYDYVNGGAAGGGARGGSSDGKGGAAGAAFAAAGASSGGGIGIGGDGGSSGTSLGADSSSSSSSSSSSNFGTTAAASAVGRGLNVVGILPPHPTGGRTAMTKRYAAHLRRGATTDIVQHVLGQLLTVAVSDTWSTVRATVIEALAPHFDMFLAEPEHLRPLLIALNDEEFVVRARAVTVVRRLAPRNPAYVLPPLRRLLIQLLTELQFSEDNRTREESVRTLGQILCASKQLIRCYLRPIISALRPRLDAGACSASSSSHSGSNGGGGGGGSGGGGTASGGGSTPSLSTAVLETLGELCRVAGTSARCH